MIPIINIGPKGIAVLSTNATLTNFTARFFSGAFHMSKYLASLRFFTGILMAVTSAVASTSVAASDAADNVMDIYYPGTEELAADEMRVVACGTGMPSPRPKQAAACFQDLLNLLVYREVPSRDNPEYCLHQFELMNRLL